MVLWKTFYFKKPEVPCTVKNLSRIDEDDQGILNKVLHLFSIYFFASLLAPSLK